MVLKRIILIICAFTVNLQAQVPLFHWAKSIPDTISVQSIAFDQLGNIITGGVFSGTVDFDPGPGTYNLTAGNGLLNPFIYKLDAAGNFAWAKQMKSVGSPNSGTGSIYDLTTDLSGNVYSVGKFAGTVDFDPALLATCIFSTNNTYEGFISKLDAAGNFVWAKQLTVGHRPSEVSVDTGGNVYTCGSYTGTSDFDPGAPVLNLSSNGSKDIFISKFDGAGNFSWVKSMGGIGDDEPYSLKIDGMNNIYTSGSFEGTVDFDPGVNAVSVTSAGLSDIFISKLDQAGNYVWVRSFGGTEKDYGVEITIDASNDVYTAGEFRGVIDFDPGAGVSNLDSINGNSFVLKLNQAGTYSWGKNLPGGAKSLAVDSAKQVYTIGSFRGTADFDPGPGVFTLSENLSVTQGNFFLSVLNPSGNFVFAGQIPSTYPAMIDSDVFGNIGITGTYYLAADFDLGTGVFNLLTNFPVSVPHMFVLKMGTSPAGIKTEPGLHDIFSLYPNPTEGYFNIGFTKFVKPEIEILNCLGQVIDTFKASNEMFTVDLSNQVSGIYFVKVKSRGTVVTRKIIKQ